MHPPFPHPTFCRNCYRSFPKYSRISIFISGSQTAQTLLKKVIQGSVDFGLTGSMTDAENCCFTPFCTDSLVLAAPVTPEYLELADTLKKDEPVTLQHFSLPSFFILRANGSGTRKGDRLIFRTAPDLPF